MEPVGDRVCARQRKGCAVTDFETVTASASELIKCLREHWNLKDEPNALTLFMISILGGISEEWRKNPPANGFTWTGTFPNCPPLTITIHRQDGESPAKAINRLIAEVAAEREACARIADAHEDHGEWRHDVRHGCADAIAAEIRARGKEGAK